MQAILTSLKISTWTNSIVDKQITTEVTQSKGAKDKALRVSKKKLAGDTLAKLTKLCGVARTEHYRLTASWDDGIRVLPLALRAEYERTMDEISIEFNRLVTQFCGEYPDLVQQARIDLGEAFKPEDYPMSPEHKFAFRWEFSPIPEANHFVIGGLIDAEKVKLESDFERYRVRLQSDNERRIQGMHADILERALTPIQRLTEKLSDSEAIFRDSLVENVRESMRVLETLNIESNPTLAALRQTIGEQLSNLDADMLRENKVLRRSTAEAAGQIVKVFNNNAVRKF